MLGTLKKFSYRQLPHWAQPDHPIMRSVMGYNRQTNWRRMLLRLGFLIALIAVAVAAGYIYAEQNSDEAPTLRETLYWPLVAGQILAMLLAIIITTNVVAQERQQQTWDSLKLSLIGVGLMLRARWASVFFRLWWLMAAITIGRLVYFILMLQDMTEFQGRALDLYISGITPEISLDSAILLMTALMTSFILQPFISVALAAAVGIMISVFTHTRSVVILGLLLLVGLRLATSVGSLVVGGTIFENTVGITPEVAELSTTQAWSRLVLSSLEGDMMLKLFHLDTLGQIWADVKNAVYIGGIMLALTLIQAVIANILVIFAAWRASKPSSF